MPDPHSKNGNGPLTQRGVSIAIESRWVWKIFLPLILVIVGAGAMANVTMYQWIQDPDSPIFKLLKRIDLTNEPSLPSWYSSLSLVFCSVLLTVISINAFRSRSRSRFHWLLLGVMFFLMGLDEAIMIHEMAVTPIKNLLGTSGVLAIAWIIPGFVAVVFVAIVYFKFVMRLPPSTRWRVILAATIFVIGGIGMEMPGGIYFEKHGFETWHYITSYAIEEFLEMFAILLFATTLLDHIRDNIGDIRIAFPGTGEAAP